MTLQNKIKKTKQTKNQTQNPPTLTQLQQLRKGRRVQNSEVNHYSYKTKGVWSLGSATIYTCTIITNSQCLPISKKKKKSALIQIFLLKNRFKSSIFWMQISLIETGGEGFSSAAEAGACTARCACRRCARWWAAKLNALAGLQFSPDGSRRRSKPQSTGLLGAR